MKREVLTFRDKLGCMLMSPGIMLLMFVGFAAASIVGIFINNLVANFFATGTHLPLPGVTTYRVLLILSLVGIALIRLSFYTVKKQPRSS